MTKCCATALVPARDFYEIHGHLREPPTSQHRTRRNLLLCCSSRASRGVTSDPVKAAMDRPEPPTPRGSAARCNFCFEMMHRPTTYLLTGGVAVVAERRNGTAQPGLALASTRSRHTRGEHRRDTHTHTHTHLTDHTGCCCCWPAMRCTHLQALVLQVAPAKKERDTGSHRRSHSHARIIKSARGRPSEQQTKTNRPVRPPLVARNISYLTHPA